MYDSAVPLLHTGRGDRNLRLSGRTDLVRVRQSVYAPASKWGQLKPWEQYELRVRAFRLTHPREILSHDSALVANGLPLFGNPAQIHVFDGQRTSSVTIGDVMHHTSVNGRPPVTTGLGAATNLVDTAIDIGRIRNRAHSLAVWDAVLRKGVDLDAIARRWRSQASSRGTRALAWLTQRATRDSESPGESVSRALIEWLGYASPVLQHPVETPEGAWRLDFAWLGARVAGEFDGYEKYNLHGAGVDEAFRQEKRREDSLRRAGFRVARWEYHDLSDPMRLDRILRSAGLVPVNPPDLAMLRAYRPTGPPRLD